jgi:hypothetical protein
MHAGLQETNRISRSFQEAARNLAKEAVEYFVRPNSGLVACGMTASAPGRVLHVAAMSSYFFSSSEQPPGQGCLGRQYEIVGGSAQRDLIGAFGDAPLAGVSIEAGEESRIHCHGHTARLARLQLDTLKA